MHIRVQIFAAPDYRYQQDTAINFWPPRPEFVWDFTRIDDYKTFDRAVQDGHTSSGANHNGLWRVVVTGYPDRVEVVSGFQGHTRIF